MLTGNYKKFCNNFELCEGYEKALNSNEPYFLHHIQGEYMSKEELIEYDWYFICHPSCLKWVTKSEHQKIHNSHIRFETRHKLSNASSTNNYMKGRHHTIETRRKLSESHKGKTYNNNEHWIEMHSGENNVSKRQDVRIKISNKAKNRYKITRDDGTWYWGHKGGK